MKLFKAAFFLKGYILSFFSFKYKINLMYTFDGLARAKEY